MTPASPHRRFVPMMWGAIVVTFMVLVTVAVLRIDPRIAGYAVGSLVLVCLVACGLAMWIESRASRATARLARHRSESGRGPAWDVRPR